MMVSGCSGNSQRTAFAITLLLQRACRWIGGEQSSSLVPRPSRPNSDANGFECSYIIRPVIIEDV
jgi:hypothetical protein